MTDQIAALLDEQEERERREAIELKLTDLAGGPVGRAQAEAGPEGIQDINGAGRAGRRETVVLEETERGTESIYRLRPDAAASGGITARLETRPGRETDTGGAQDSWIITAAGQSAGLPPEQDRQGADWADQAVRESLRPLVPFLTAQGMPDGIEAAATAAMGTPGLGVERLDRVFQRDARRYDGGFRLR